MTLIPVCPENWKILMNSVEIDRLVQKCANEINAHFKGKSLTLVCLLKGAVYFFVDLSRKLDSGFNICFLEISSYHNQLQGNVNINNTINLSTFENRYVLIIDELYDQGNTLTSAVEYINRIGVPLNRIFTCTAFVKCSQNNQLPNFYGVKVPNVWLVGYGLDDNQEKREYRCIMACPKTPGLPTNEYDELFQNNDKYLEYCQDIIDQL